MARYFMICFLFSCGHTNNKPKQSSQPQHHSQSQNIENPQPSSIEGVPAADPHATTTEVQTQTSNIQDSPHHMNEDHNLLTKYAPHLIFHKEESYYPSSISFFLENTVEEEGHYTSKEELECPDCQNLKFLTGIKPEDNPEIYAFLRERSPSTKDLIYFIFYPYNLGKEVCIGVEGLFLDGVFDDLLSDADSLIDTVSETVQGCVGSKVRFGNHVGDWEHITVRLENNIPQEVFLSAHGNGETILWDDISKKEDHLEAYVALGSHGMYSKPEDHVYKELPNGAQLIDRTNHGETWTSHENLVFIPEYDIGSYPQEFQWMNFTGRWGNPKDGCALVESISGECRLNSGPTGPALKGVLESQDLQLSFL